jgi:hypothetical protein
MNTENTIPDKIPNPPQDSVFRLSKVDTVTFPHPYCITPKHLELSDSHILDAASITHAESRGAKCDICNKNGREILPYSEHRNETTLFIKVPQNKDLNAVEGLHAYLLSIKNICTELGITGFAFPCR